MIEEAKTKNEKYEHLSKNMEEWFPNFMNVSRTNLNQLATHWLPNTIFLERFTKLAGSQILLRKATF